MTQEILTQDYLKSILRYDPETGFFKWIIRKGPQALIGRIAGWKDNTKGSVYMRVKINSKTYRIHRLAWFYMKGYWPDEIDHNDGNGLNNKWSNLRNTDRRGQMMNAKRPSTNKSGIIGVHWNMGKWVASIKVAQKRYHLGRFDHLFQAAFARKSAENKYGFHINHGR